MIAEGGEGSYNFATGESHTIREAVECLTEVAGFAGEVVWDATKPDGQFMRSYDVSRLNALGFTPRFGLKEALRETYEWFSANVETARR
jgi:GDP-L-fucose synthase